MYCSLCGQRYCVCVFPLTLIGQGVRNPNLATLEAKGREVGDVNGSFHPSSIDLVLQLSTK